MAEYTARMDSDKTVPIMPRPLTKVRHRIRALNLTGDETGRLPTDDQMFWQGLDYNTMKKIEGQEIARYQRDIEIDRLWG